MNSFIIKGDIAWSEDKDTLNTTENAYLVVKEGIVQGVFQDIEKDNDYEFIDCNGKLIIPGMVDLHIHAPQFAFRGTGMDKELLPWLNSYTFPEEIKFEDSDYARKSYSLFADQLRRSATTRAVVFGTIHEEACDILMSLLEESGLVSYVGKVNMDRNCNERLKEADSATVTRSWLEKTINKYTNTHPIITPRLGVGVSPELLRKLSDIAKEYHLPLQSHLSENQDEVETVKRLCPDAAFYGDYYDQNGCFGKEIRTIMAHCVYSGEDEIKRIKDNGVMVAHCPSSNLNLSSGMAPVRKYLDLKIPMGLGSDIAGGANESIFEEIIAMIQTSKMVWRYLYPSLKPVRFEEAFYTATMAGGSFFGKCGSFQKGYEADILVIDDLSYPSVNHMDIASRLERAVYLHTDLTALKAKFVRGKRIF